MNWISKIFRERRGQTKSATVRFFPRSAPGNIYERYREAKPANNAH